MSLFPKLIKNKRSKYSPSSDYWYNPYSQKTSSGVGVSEKDALKYSTVFACISLIAGDLARLPLNLYKKRKDGGKDVITDHNLYDLLHNAPNDETTSFNYREAAQGHLLLWGNHYSTIERSKTGEINKLYLLPDPSKIQIKRNNSNEIIYVYNKDNEKIVKRRDEIFHLPGFGYNGLYGLSMVSLVREAIGLGLAQEEFASKFFGDGVNPSITITMPEGIDLGENASKYLEELKKSYGGLSNSQGIMLLPNGEKVDRLTMPLVDAQFIESRDHSKVDICGFYRVPPHKVGIHGRNSNYNNLEQENASYVDSCLMPWLVRWESNISLQLLTKEERKQGYFFEFLVQGLLRGDSQARSEYYNKLFQVGALSPNQILAKENMNPIPGGDQHFVMLNMIPLDQSGQIQDKETPDDEKNIDKIINFFKIDKEKRSILTRDRISKRYKPLILDAAAQIVSRETKAIKKQFGARALTEEYNEFLKDFYGKFKDYIEQKIGPVLRSYFLAVIDATVNDLKVKFINFDKEIKEYIENYITRHIESSLSQMLILLENEGPEGIEKRADEWAEKRPEKIANNEATRAGNAAFLFVAFGAGLKVKWKIRGAETCPYCKSLSEKIISKGQSFVSNEDQLTPEGEEPMKIYGTKMHPPLHQGCDCYISASKEA